MEPPRLDTSSTYLLTATVLVSVTVFVWVLERKVVSMILQGPVCAIYSTYCSTGLVSVTTLVSVWVL